MAASCFAVCSLSIFSSISFAGDPAVTFLSVDLDLGLLLSRESDLRTRLGDLDAFLRSGLLGERLGERLGDRLLLREWRGGDGRRGDDRLWGEGRLGERGLGDVLLTVLSVLGLTGDLDLLFRLGDLLLRRIGLLLLRGDLDFLLGDRDFLRGDRVRRLLGLLGLSVLREGLDR